MGNSLPKTELCDRFERVYPGAVTDVLDERGLRNQTLSPAIEPLENHMQMAGIAFPIVGRPNRTVDEEENIRNILKMWGDAPEDSALIYDTHSDQSAQLGELSVTSLKARDCRGAVVDGGTRDIRYILDQDFPVFTRFCTPVDSPPRWEILDWNVSTIIDGVEIHPGDIVVADIDGVVIVPQDIAHEVLLEAEAVVEDENLVREAVVDGMLPIDAYDKYGAF